MKVLFVYSYKSHFSTGGMSPFLASQCESLEALGVTVERFPIKKKGIPGYMASIWSLRRYLRSYPVDIVHAHYGLCGIVASLASKKEKVVVSFMGDDLVGSVGNNGSYTRLGHWLARLNRYFARRRYHWNITKSSRLRRILDGVDRVSVIPNGVDATVFAPSLGDEARQRLGLAPGRKLVIFVSHPDRPEKNFKLAADAMALLNRDDVDLLPVYGVPHHRLVDYYNAADVLVLTSYHEGSPNVVKEAMACNLPVVSVDVGDVADVVGATAGCYVCKFDAAAVALNLELALNFEGRTGGRADLERKGLFLESVAKRLLTLYRDILELE
jgi:glycosyltransferase involved in cell wall biosynthesis